MKNLCLAACLALGAAPVSVVGTPAQAQSEKVLYAFGTDTGGTSPSPGNLVRLGDTIYGTTMSGGKPGCGGGCGAVFRIGPDGAYAQVYAFKGGRDGEWPNGLIAVGGVLYGVTYLGGTGQLCQPYFSAYTGCGTVFRLTPSGEEKVLYSFQGGSDGNRPVGLVAVNGTLIGVTANGGFAGPACSQEGCGTIFEITADGKYKQLYQFLGGAYDGSQPQGSLVVSHGLLFGLTAGGGFNLKGCNGSCGTAFKFRLDDSAPEGAIHFFGPPDGANPSGLIDVDNRLYGLGGGDGNTYGGTLFEMTLTGRVSVLHTWPVNSFPFAIVRNDAGVIDGVAYGGGSSTCQCGYVFTLGAGNAHYTDLYDFQGGSDGNDPTALLAAGGLIFGATEHGGGNPACETGCGTIFRLVP
jgi:hypothetical protein